MDRYAMADMGEVRIILGMSVTTNYGKRNLNQHSCVHQTNLMCPEHPGEVQDAEQPTRCTEEMQPEGKILGIEGIGIYQEPVGSILPLAQATRDDICYA